MPVSPLNVYVEILALDAMILGGKGFGQWLGHEGGDPVNGINALVKETLERSSSLFLPCEKEKLAVCILEEDPQQNPIMLCCC